MEDDNNDSLSPIEESYLYGYIDALEKIIEMLVNDNEENKKCSQH